jgi:AbrB family looped-hinge helix DNA binding protein
MDVPFGEIIAVSRVYGKGRLQLPKEVRLALGVGDGDRVLFVRDAEGRITIERASPKRGVGKYPFP